LLSHPKRSLGDVKPYKQCRPSLPMPLST